MADVNGLAFIAADAGKRGHKYFFPYLHISDDTGQFVDIGRFFNGRSAYLWAERRFNIRARKTRQEKNQGKQKHQMSLFHNHPSPFVPKGDKRRGWDSPFRAVALQGLGRPPTRLPRNGAGPPPDTPPLSASFPP